MENRRSSTRYPVSLEGELAVAGQPRACRLENLSMGGALVAAGPLAMGQRVTLRFAVPVRGEPAPIAIEAGAVVRWIEGTSVGVQFDGLRARETWALGKFLEQVAAG